MKHLIVGGKVYEKDRIAAFLSFLAGLVSFFGIVVYLGIFFSIETIIEQLTKITCQSNLLSFFVSAFYLYRPNHKAFKTNLLPLLAICLLWFAGLGFWFILFPVYWVDLGKFLLHDKDLQYRNFSLFYSIWNHTVTQIFFLIFFYYLNKKDNFWHLTPIPKKNLLIISYVYLLGWVAWNIFISFASDIFPTYGFLTNFNPYTKFVGEDLTTNLFSLRSLIWAHLACAVLILSISALFSSMSIKMRLLNLYETTGEIATELTSKY